MNSGPWWMAGGCHKWNDGKTVNWSKDRASMTTNSRQKESTIKPESIDIRIGYTAHWKGKYGKLLSSKIVRVSTDTDGERHIWIRVLSKSKHPDATPHSRLVDVTYGLVKITEEFTKVIWTKGDVL